MDKYLINKVFYNKAIDKFGVSAQGVHWNNKSSQYKRFEVITKLIKKNIQNSTLVDVGCGFAEYYNYLEQKKKLPLEYMGIDCEDRMIDISIKRFPHQKFYLKDVLKDSLINADYLICSGGLNILNIQEVELFIKKCFEYSNQGFVFNFLKNVTFVEISQYEIIDICKKYTKNIIIKEDYLDNDFTIFMVK